MISCLGFLRLSFPGIDFGTTIRLKVSGDAQVQGLKRSRQSTPDPKKPMKIG
ncbi:MAG: hypothetical protein V7L21_27555 [Nostoc sp.]|uniref:hypothetical protein n=1 Tax=Nostoc sp. TaxID=1180 RepID=UPI002FF6EDC7